MFCAKLLCGKGSVCKNAYVPLFRCAKASLYKASVCKNFLLCVKPLCVKVPSEQITFFRIISHQAILFWRISLNSIWYLHFLSYYHIFYRHIGGIFKTRSFVVEVRRATLWSGARGWGPAGITPIQRLLFGSGKEHCDLEFAVVVVIVVVSYMFCGSGWHSSCYLLLISCCCRPAGKLLLR